ncbi:MAG: ABC transporter permease [Candidatus Atribacteria bacterium]|nr:ABC transporter permease [Candidatus Atribacteria bacterium]
MKERQQNIRLYIPIYFVVASIYIIAGFIEPTFLSWNNNVNLFTRITPLIIVGMAQTFVILTGGIDLSIGAIIGLTNVIAASLPYVDTPINIALWLIIPPAVGLGAGLINGVIIAKKGLPPLIVTLATSAILLGVALFIMPIPGGTVSLSVALLLTGKLFNIIPVPLLIFSLTVFIGHFILRKTEFGRSLYALGGNEAIAYESGIPCTKVKIMVYGISGLLGAIAGMYISGWMFSADPLIGDPYVLNSIAVAVISGTRLSGGKGGVVGIIGGAYIFYLLNNILNLLGIISFYQYIAKGLVLIIALIISSPEISFSWKKYIHRFFSVKRNQELS